MSCTGDSIHLLDFSGQIIDHGRYFLIRIIGFGTYGCVYHAVDTTSNPSHPRFYAVKCLSKTVHGPRRHIQQERELIIHDRVSDCSPYILSLHDIIEEELYLYLVLDLSETDLYEAVVRSKLFRYNDSLIRQAFLEILDGVQACHRRGVFHRDLKLENILCKKDGTGMLIADFGLATRKLVSTDFRCGTSCYMSPECYNRGSVYPHYFPLYADIWSLGLILVNMVAGYPPWQLPIPSDHDFLAFLHNENYFRETLGISQPLNDLLNRVINPDPLARISIPELRKEILKMDTFFKRFEGRPAVPPGLRKVPIGHDQRVPRGIPAAHHATELTLVDPYDESDDDIPRRDWSYGDSEHISALREPVQLAQASYGGFYSEICDRTRGLVIGRDSGSSDVDSEGPTTPEALTRVLVVRNVGDLPEEEGLRQKLAAALSGKPRDRPVQHNMLHGMAERLMGR